MEHKWYVVHTYSGYENRVEAALWDRVRAERLGGPIFRDLGSQGERPGEGERRGPARKFFPGYIFVKMELNTETWHIVNGYASGVRIRRRWKDAGSVRPVPRT